MSGTVAIIGLGLIGGSLARDLAAQGVVVLGFDRDARSTQAALDAGVIGRILPDDFAGIEAADTVVLAVPVGQEEALLERLRPRIAAVRLLTDVGSTKRAIAAAASRFGLAQQFVGGHPLAGYHEAGWAAARPGLFRDARVFLCPLPESAPAALAAAEALWTRVGAKPERIDAEAHDQLLAWTSHLPQLAASALALALDEQGLGRALLGPGGRDTTRLAGSDPLLWTAVAGANADFLATSLAALEEELRGLRAALEREDGSALRQAFERAATWHLAGEPRSNPRRAEPV